MDVQPASASSGGGDGDGGGGAAVTIHDLPDVILSNIFAAISDTRTRNAASLVCHKWKILERATRTSLTLRGNARDLFFVPDCFRSVTHLDLSLLSPWGNSFPSSSPSNPETLSLLLRSYFPWVNSLTIYARTPSTLQFVALLWPQLSHVKLVRWHQRLQSAPGADFVALFEQCRSLSSLDLSSFYYWTEDLPPVLATHSHVAANLTKLNLLTSSFTEGFKAHEICAITEVCPNLKEFLVACMFDPRFNGFVGDEALLAIASNCPKLSLLHLADTSSLSNVRGDPDDEGYGPEEARISAVTLIEFFSLLPLLEELVLDICKNVRNSGAALEMLNSKCPKLKSLKLGHFHGICAGIDHQLDGIALCQGLESLSIKNSADLTDMGLIAIGRGCTKLAKFEVHGCKKITDRGIGALACLLRRTLVEVKISCCKNLDAASSLHALDPVRDWIKRLHIDCIWDSDAEKAALCFDLNELEDADDREGAASMKKKRKCSPYGDCSNGYLSKTWDRLQYLSLWIGMGQRLTPLRMVGLGNCPNLEEISLRVEGDCRERSKPPARTVFGLETLARYPRLSKMKLDCGDTIGNALTAPPGQMDLSLWERFYLNRIGNLRLSELDYWPPQDRDLNQRSLSLPAVGLLAECVTLRKLFIHGTANEHFMSFLLGIPNLRDAQLREDYYPAPENDMSTEMRVDSCTRFEDALNRRRILD